MGAGHSHGDPAAAAAVAIDHTTERRLTLVSAALAVLVVLGAAALWPREQVEVSAALAAETVRAEVVSVVDCPEEFQVPDNDDIACDFVTVRLLEGPDAGLDWDLAPLYDNRTDFRVGQGLVLNRFEGAEEAFRYSFADRYRLPTLGILAVAFVLAVVALGRLRGLAALGGLLLSMLVLGLFTLPALLLGTWPLGVAAITAGLIAYLALYLAHGFGPMTTVAVLGTLAALALTTLLGTVFLDLARFSGFVTEEALILDTVSRIDAQGLLLAGLVIGALGALDDMTVTQSSVVFELRAANASMSRAELVAAGLRVGRDHVASTVNTLFLAYAGAALPVLLLFAVGGRETWAVANSELVAIEIVRALVGSIGLVAAVPLTTMLAALVVGPGEGEGWDLAGLRRGIDDLAPDDGVAVDDWATEEPWHTEGRGDGGVNGTSGR